MNKTLLILFTLITFSTTAAEKVINGVSVENELYPWQVKYTVQWGDTARSCGGTLIAPQWVLTAAHCLVKDFGKATANDLKVDIGSVKKEQLTYPYRVKRMIAHPDYELKTLLNDVALLQLSRPVNQGEFIALPNPHTAWDKQINNRLKVSGWGKTRNESNSGSKTLNITDLPIVDSQLCRQHYKEFGDKQLCVGELAGGKDSCQGDSGGPLFRGIENTAVQYGVVSYGGERCASKDNPAVYTRVADYIDWIQSAMGNDSQQLTLVKEAATPIVIPTNVPKGKRALLIGVNDYYLGGAMNLFGTNNDVDNMRQLLIQQFGFAPKQILTLKDSQATAENIRYAVKHWLIKQTRAGDTVWLQFSGHGGFLLDTNGDEKTIDAQLGAKADETIFPYDIDILTFVQKYTKSFDAPYLVTMNHILDDEVNTWTEQLKNRNLTLIFDSCHSGTADRSVNLSTKYKSGVYAMNRFLGSKFSTAPKFVTTLKTGTTIPMRNKSAYPNHAFWSAVSSSQRAVDTGRGGVFTNAFIAGINGKADNNGDGDISYSELLAYVDAKSGFDKTPTLHIKPSRLENSIFTNTPLSTPQEVTNQILSNNNPYRVKISWVDAQTEQPADHLAYCADDSNPSCTQYKVKITSEKPGWLLLYEVSEGGKLQQFFPAQIIEDQFPNQYSGEISANKPFILPLPLLMTDKKTNQLIAIVLSSEEKANYNRLATRFVENIQADDFFYNEILHRDRVIGKDGQLSPWSVNTLKYQAK